MCEVGHSERTSALPTRSPAVNACTNRANTRRERGESQLTGTLNFQQSVAEVPEANRNFGSVLGALLIGGLRCAEVRREEAGRARKQARRLGPPLVLVLRTGRSR